MKRSAFFGVLKRRCADQPMSANHGGKALFRNITSGADHRRRAHPGRKIPSKFPYSEWQGSHRGVAAQTASRFRRLRLGARRAAPLGCALWRA